MYSHHSQRNLKWQVAGNKRHVYVRLAKGVNTIVHHLVAEVFIGPRPEGMLVCHRNDDPLDNRITNLYYGTKQENEKDKTRNGFNVNASKTHCKRGHSLEDAYVQKDGGRDCRVCRKERHERARFKRLCMTEVPF